MDASGKLDQAQRHARVRRRHRRRVLHRRSSTREAEQRGAQNNTFGVLKLTLHPTSYDWQFVPEAGKTSPTPAAPPVTGAAAAAPAPAASCGRDLAGHLPGDGLARRFPTASTPSAGLGLSDVSLSPERFAVASVAAAAKGGTTFRYALSEAATVTISLQRRSVGRKVGGRCRTRTREPPPHGLRALPPGGPPPRPGRSGAQQHAVQRLAGQAPAAHRPLPGRLPRR